MMISALPLKSIWFLWPGVGDGQNLFFKLWCGYKTIGNYSTIMIILPFEQINFIWIRIDTDNSSAENIFKEYVYRLQ